MPLCRSLSHILLLAVSLVAEAGTSVAQSDSSVPRTIDDAVRTLRTRWLPPAEIDRLLRTPKGIATAQLHFPFGMQVRNAFGLWGKNTALLHSCGVVEPEDCSGIIFDRLWEAIRRDADSALVRALDCQFRLAARVQIRYRGFYRLHLSEILDSMQHEIDNQLPSLQTVLPAGCPTPQLQLRPQEGPNGACWARIEFSEDGRDPVSLESFLGWFSWRNAFTPVHVPPYLDLRFNNPCAWASPPVQFQPSHSPG